MSNFDQIKIIKKLGAGMLGTTYLVENNNKKYAMKVQHILEEETTKNYKYELWREFDLYKYIDKLSKEDQVFFTKLYGYTIYSDCNHKQIRPYQVDMKNPKDEFAKRLKKLDESEWCIKMLLEYKGDINLAHFLTKYRSKITKELAISLCLQICKIILILYDGGYSHGDLHPGNIMITKTDKKYFNIMGKKVPTFGYILSAIDYGMVMHRKFKNKTDKQFLNNRKQWCFTEMYNSTMQILSNDSILIKDCQKNNKKLPWEKKGNIYDIATNKMLSKHPDFFTMVRHKYVNMFPNGEKLLDTVVKSAHLNKSIFEMVADKKNGMDFWNIINRIVTEFSLFFPVQYTKYWGWCSYYDSIIPINMMQELLLINSYDKYVETFISFLVPN